MCVCERVCVYVCVDHLRGFAARVSAACQDLLRLCMRKTTRCIHVFGMYIVLTIYSLHKVNSVHECTHNPPKRSAMQQQVRMHAHHTPWQGAPSHDTHLEKSDEVYNDIPWPAVAIAVPVAVGQLWASRDNLGEPVALRNPVAHYMPDTCTCAPVVVRSHVKVTPWPFRHIKGHGYNMLLPMQALKGTKRHPSTWYSAMPHREGKRERVCVCMRMCA
jgi:hypothetical protein